MNVDETKNNNVISLKDIILKIKAWGSYLLSFWLIIITLGIVGAVSGFCYAYFKKTLYISTTTFVLEAGDNGNAAGEYSSIASAVGVDLGQSGTGIFQGDNILYLYKSQSMIKKALLSPLVEKPDELLIDSYIKINNLRELWDKDPKLKGISFKKSAAQEDSLDRLHNSILLGIISDISANYLTVGRPDKKNSVIQVDVKSEDEQFSKEFNDAIVKNVNDFYVQTKTKKNVDNVQIISGKVDSIRRAMYKSIYTSAKIADETPNLNPTRLTQRIAPAQQSQFSAEANKSILADMLKNLEMAKINLLKETPLIQIVDNPSYPLKTERLGMIRYTLLSSVMLVFLTITLLFLRKFFYEIMKN